MIGGVATGWHGWTMPKGPGAKGAPERERQKNEEYKRKKKRRSRKEKKRKEKKRENETFQILRQGVPMSLSR